MTSMWTGLNLSHVMLVARFASRFALRTGGGLIFLLILLVSGLGVAAAFIAPVEEMVKSELLQDVALDQGETLDVGVVIREVSEMPGVRRGVQAIVGGDERESTYLLAKNPALLSAIFVVMLILIPFLACFGGFNQTSGDIQNRGLRYLLLRTERVNIFLGRLLGVVLFTLIYVAALVALVLVYIGLKLQIYGAGELCWWGLQGYVALVLLVLPYMALCAWLSAAIDSPFGSLVLCLMLVGLPIAFLAALSAVARLPYETLSRFLPWGWKYELLSGDVGTRLVAITAMLGFTGLFVLVGLRTFSRRDL